MKIALEAAAPWVAVAIGGIGPYVSGYLIREVRYHGLRYVCSRAKRQAASIADDSPIKPKVEANVQQLEMMLSEMIQDTARFWQGH